MKQYSRASNFFLLAINLAKQEDHILNAKSNYYNTLSLSGKEVSLGDFFRIFEQQMNTDGQENAFITLGNLLRASIRQEKEGWEFYKEITEMLVKQLLNVQNGEAYAKKLQQVIQEGDRK